MPPRKLSHLIEDIQNAIAQIQEYLSAQTVENLINDKKTLDAVLYNFAIIGESASKITTAVRNKYSEVPWKLMVSMRNIVVHEYFRVDLEILWNTVQTDLPVVIPYLSKIKNELDSKINPEPKKRKK